LTARRARRREDIDAELVAQRSASMRDAGLRRIGDVTRWLMAATAGLIGALALVAAGAFHGHSVSVTTPPAAAAGANQAASTSDGLQAPAQAPQPAVSAPVVVSGGS
jgi:hypothetical protein